MKTKNKTAQTQGVDQSKPTGLPKDATPEQVKEYVNNLDIDQVEKWMRADAARAANMLTAIATDPNVSRAMATYLVGKVRNQVNRPDPNQMDMFVQSNKAQA